MRTYQDVLLAHEGLELRLYKDTKGILTIGVGRNIQENGISKDEAMYLLENDIKKAQEDLRKIFSNFDKLPHPIKLVLVDMMFNLGYDRFSGFKHMIAAVKGEDWKGMIAEMRDSKWCKELSNRCQDDVNIVKRFANLVEL